MLFLLKKEYKTIAEPFYSLFFVKKEKKLSF